MKLSRIILTLTILLTPFVYSKDLTFASPEEVGMSSDRLSRIKPAMQRFIDEGKTIGIQTIIARNGKIVHFEQVGKLNLVTGAEIKSDSLFRIYSMTKPIVTTAAMILFEEGAFLLDDPVEKYLPEFKDKKVLIDGALVDATHPFTIRELMSHTAGLTYGIFGNSPIDQQYRKAMFGENHVFNFENVSANGSSSKIKTLEDLVTAIGPIPLQYQPGTQWVYSLSVDILGAIIEKISNKTLDVFLNERLFQQLDMNDTFFEVPKTKIERFGTLQRLDRDGKIIVAETPETSIFADSVTFLSGGGGLVSTAMDFLRYSQMMLNGGELNGMRILSPMTVDLMLRNQLTYDQQLKYDPRPGIAGTTGFGLGFGLKTESPKTSSGSKGNFRWAGIAGTDFWCDPQEGITAIVLMQVIPYPQAVRAQFKNLTYQAITEMN